MDHKENADTQLLNSTKQADSASTVSDEFSDNFANVDSVELKRLQDLDFNKIWSAQLTPGSIGLNRGEYQVSWKLEDIPLPNFDEILQQFFAELKTCKGKDYEPGSLCTMLGALNCHLRDSGCAHRINDEQFLGTKWVLNGKAIDLYEKGKG